MRHVFITLCVVAFFAGEIFEHMRSKTSEFLPVHALRVLTGGGCNNTANKQVTCNTEGGVQPCNRTGTCTKGGGTTCAMLTTVSPNICEGTQNNQNCIQTNSGICGTVKTGTIGPGGTCPCDTTANGCGSQNSTTTTEGCGG